jgi:ankyrin repeat protein
MIEHYSDFDKQNSIYDYIDTIIDHLADLNKLNETDKDNNTALIHACNEGLSNIAIKLIINDADTTLRGSLGTARSICEANPKTMATVLSKLTIYGSTKKSRRTRTRRRVVRRRVARRRATRRSRT